MVKPRSLANRAEYDAPVGSVSIPIHPAGATFDEKMLEKRLDTPQWNTSTTEPAVEPPPEPPPPPPPPPADTGLDTDGDTGDTGDTGFFDTGDAGDTGTVPQDNTLGMDLYHRLAQSR